MGLSPRGRLREDEKPSDPSSLPTPVRRSADAFTGGAVTAEVARPPGAGGTTDARPRLATYEEPSDEMSPPCPRVGAGSPGPAEELPPDDVEPDEPDELEAPPPEDPDELEDPVDTVPPPDDAVRGIACPAATA